MNKSPVPEVFSHSETHDGTEGADHTGWFLALVKSDPRMKNAFQKCMTAVKEEYER